jgi:hypothetical protein
VPAYTPTQQRILGVLSDGRPHWPTELQAVLNDELSEDGVRRHVCDLRKLLRPIGQDIKREYWQYRWCYVLVRLVHPVSAV